MSLFHPIKDPVEGTMHVVSCTAIDSREMRAPCHITYVVQSPGMAAFSGDYVFEMWTAEWPEPGEDIPVIFDREHPDRIKIDNEKRKANWVSPEDQAAQLAQQINAGSPTLGMPVTPIVIDGADQAQVADAMAQAERVMGADLDGDGVVGSTARRPQRPRKPRLPRRRRRHGLPPGTPRRPARPRCPDAEEFEAQKAKILAG